jgi:hypothetical protein
VNVVDEDYKDYRRVDKEEEEGEDKDEGDEGSWEDCDDNDDEEDDGDKDEGWEDYDDKDVDDKGAVKVDTQHTSKNVEEKKSDVNDNDKRKNEDKVINEIIEDLHDIEMTSQSSRPPSLSRPLHACLLSICSSIAYLSGDALGAVTCLRASVRENYIAGIDIDLYG